VRRLRLIVALCSACVALLAHAALVAADVFSPIQLLSSRPVQVGPDMILEQAESAGESTISGDGRYVAFVGSYGGISGIWRRDLETGEVEQVAPGLARLPSISENGEFVSFTTPEALAPEADHNKAPDVYMRDMARPCESEGGKCLPCGKHQEELEPASCPFILVSVVNGTHEGATYAYPKKGTQREEEKEEENYGSLASGRSAMSANGKSVVFETAAQSNLLGSPTPAREILLRNLESEETRLVSSEYDPQTGSDTGVPVPLATENGSSNGSEFGAAFAVGDFGNASFGGASISADGSTVAWLGQEIGLQAKLLAGEQAGYKAQYDEPLWRRVNEGPSAPTLRVTGGSEPENPLCVASGETQLPSTPSLLDPCQGPFAVQGLPEFYLVNTTNGNFVPQLSKNGDTVAFVASAREVAAGQEILNSEADDDLYISHMGDGLTRVRALRRLTEIAGDITKPELAAPIVDLTIAPDGSQVAFTTQRTQFPLGSLSDVSQVAAKANLKELFDVDLDNETLTRVTHGYTGEAAPSEFAGEGGAANGASSPSFSENGDLLSFSSSADNLVYGDGNAASDVFLVKRTLFTDSQPPQYLSSPPAPPTLTPEWQLYASAVPQADGAVVLDVTVPGAGELKAYASGVVPVRVRARHGGRVRTALAARTVASARAGVPSTTTGLQKLTLKLEQIYSALARRSDGLYTKVKLLFTAPGHPSLRTSVDVSFRRTLRTHRARSGHDAKQAERGQR
jgi:hypothetical protein